MAVFAKDLLYPGKYTLRDGREVVFRKDEIPHYAQRLNDMTAAGLHVPLSWNHQDDAGPYYSADAKANRAKHNLGFALTAEVAADGSLAGTVDVPVAADAERLPAAKFVSPRIEENFTDSTGKIWPGKSIVHLAVTPRPVQHNQQPFQPVSLAMELSLDGVVSLGDGPPVDAKKGDPPEDPPKKTDDPKDADKPEAIPDLGSLEKLLCELEETCQLVLPADTTVQNLIERLMTALLTAKAHNEKNAPDEDEPPYPGTEPPSAATPPAVSMSADAPAVVAFKAILTRVLEKMVAKTIRPAPVAAPIQMSMDHPGAKKLRDYATRETAERIRTLAPVLGKALHDEMAATLAAQPLDLSTDGDPMPTGIIADLAAYERLLKARPKFFEASLGFEHAEPVEPPAPTVGAPQTQAETDKLVTEFFEMTGGKPAKPVKK